MYMCEQWIPGSFLPAYHEPVYEAGYEARFPRAQNLRAETGQRKQCTVVAEGIANCHSVVAREITNGCLL